MEKTNEALTRIVAITSNLLILILLLASLASFSGKVLGVKNKDR
jgi:hypothetical protein